MRYGKICPTNHVTFFDQLDDPHNWKMEPRLPRNCGKTDSRLTREGGGHIVLRRNGVEIGNSSSNTSLFRCTLSTHRQKACQNRFPIGRASGIGFGYSFCVFADILKW
jgi:hypothetical protein